MRYWLLILFLGWVSAPGLAQPLPPLVTVTGKSEIRVAPDRMDFVVRLTSENLKAEAAVAANQAQLDKLRNLLKDYPLEQGSFSATDVDLSHPWRDGRALESFQAARSCSFSLTDVSRRERLLLAFAGGNLGEVSSVSPRLSAPVPYRTKARLQALEEARKKAYAMASALGQTIGNAYSIEEVNEGWLNPVSNSNMVSNSSSDRDNNGLGQVEVSAIVKVAFLLK